MKTALRDRDVTNRIRDYLLKNITIFLKRPGDKKGKKTRCVRANFP